MKLLQIYYSIVSIDWYLQLYSCSYTDMDSPVIEVSFFVRHPTVDVSPPHLWTETDLVSGKLCS